MTDARPNRRQDERRRLARLVGRTLLRMVVMTWLVATITFLIVRGLPGNPIELFIQQLVQTGMPPDAAQARAETLLNLDLDAPLLEQYVQYMSNLLRGDLGSSSVLAPGTSVLALVMDRLPWTLISVGGALSISFWIGIRIGSLAAYRRGTKLDHVITNVSAALDAVPAVLLAVLAVLYLGVVWQVVPLDWMRGAYSPDVTPGANLPFILSAAQHMLVPGTIYVVSSIGGWAIAMRSNAISVTSEDYMMTARARGVGSRRLKSAYVRRNAQLPLVTGFVIGLGFVIGGSILIEQIFLYPGIGLLLGEAVARLDYPVIQGIVLITTIAVLIMTALADAIYGWLDPRTRIEVEL